MHPWQNGFKTPERKVTQSTTLWRLCPGVLVNTNVFWIKKMSSYPCRVSGFRFIFKLPQCSECCRARSFYGLVVLDALRIQRRSCALLESDSQNRQRGPPVPFPACPFVPKSTVNAFQTVNFSRPVPHFAPFPDSRAPEWPCLLLLDCRIKVLWSKGFKPSAMIRPSPLMSGV